MVANRTEVRMKRSFAAIIFVAIGISGCASTRLVDSEVQTFSSLGAVQAPATYRFERLPSQQSYGEAQSKLEKVAGEALAKSGMTLLGEREGAPRYTVQIGVRTQREARSPWEDGFPGSMFVGREVVVASNGQVILATPMPRAELPWYQREVSLLIRDVTSNQIVYETHAAHGGRWADGAAVLPAMFMAALNGFPNPPAGARKVVVDAQ